MAAIPKEEQITEQFLNLACAKAGQELLIASYIELAKEEDTQNAHCPSPELHGDFLGEKSRRFKSLDVLENAGVFKISIKLRWWQSASDRAWSETPSLIPLYYTTKTARNSDSLQTVLPPGGGQEGHEDDSTRR
jgi:hypothetical protein